MIRWNTDKTYLRDLAAAGVPVVPTEHLEPVLVPAWPAAWAEVVVKPAVSAGSRDTARYGPAEVDRPGPTRHAAGGRPPGAGPAVPGRGGRGR